MKRRRNRRHQPLARHQQHRARCRIRSCMPKDCRQRSRARCSLHCSNSKWNNLLVFGRRILPYLILLWPPAQILGTGFAPTPCRPSRRSGKERDGAYSLRAGPSGAEAKAGFFACIRKRVLLFVSPFATRRCGIRLPSRRRKRTSDRDWPLPLPPLGVKRADRGTLWKLTKHLWKAFPIRELCRAGNSCSPQLSKSFTRFDFHHTGATCAESQGMH